MSDQATIETGKLAWRRIKDRDKASFDDWVCVGRALIAARRACMARAKCNSANGPPYQRAMRAWLDENAMADLDTHERYGAVLIVEHLGEIEAMRATWNEAELRRGNHPNSILRCWRESRAPRQGGPKATKPRHHVVHKHAPPAQRPTQDLVRKVGLAMKLSGKSDFFSLAAVAIESLTRADLIELLGKTAEGRAAVAMELHA